MRTEINETEFSLVEVDQLTGFSPELMRAWRKRGHVSTSEKYARVKTSELASLVIKKKLMQLGYGPAESRDVSDRYAPALLHFAVIETPGVCELRGTAGAIAAFEAKYDDLNDLADLLSGSASRPQPLLVSTDGGTLEPASEISFDDDSESGYFINLVGLGRQFGAADGKVLFSISLTQPDDEGGHERVRRFPRYAR